MIRGLLLFVLTVSMLAGVGGGTVAAQSSQNFKISDFTADYYIGRTEQKVPTMEVNELIMAEFPSYNQNHGILRAIPTSYKGQPLDITIQSITNAEGQPYPFSTSTQNGNMVLKIGDPNSYVQGQTVYNIVYTLKNQISFWPDYDELYWNVNGTQWQQPFGTVTARVHIPASLAGELQQQQLCYTGSYGSNTQNCTISRSQQDDETVVTVSAQNLSAGENLSYVLAFNSGTFSVDKAAQRAKVLRYVLFFALLIATPLVVIVLLVRKWRKYGRDAAGKGTIVPEYLPPKALSVMSSDVVLHERLRTQAISATIIELCVAQYLAIHEIAKKKMVRSSTEYEIELTRAADKKLSAEQAAVLQTLFPSGKVGDRVKPSDLKTTFYKEVAKLSKSVPSQLFASGYFRNDPYKARRKYYIAGSVILFVGGFSTIFTAQLFWPLAGLSIGSFFAGLAILFAAKTMPARSAQGVEMRDYLRGLKMYMQLAEADRIQYLQSPKGVRQWGDPAKPETKIKLFEKLLPYAMIFGIEKDWAKEFQDIYSEPPDWYHGNWTAFNTVFLVSSINSFTTVSATSFSAPSSSSSSGFGGGGFSGGGGGGGGGGGW